MSVSMCIFNSATGKGIYELLHVSEDEQLTELHFCVGDSRSFASAMQLRIIVLCLHTYLEGERRRR